MQILKIIKKYIKINFFTYTALNELDKKKHFLECSIVLIENQPTLKNPKMKAISSTIYDYFLIRGIVDKQLNNSKMEKFEKKSPLVKILYTSWSFFWYYSPLQDKNSILTKT